jgi:competence ComEA-like helix-hairpin-helix protein
MINNMSKWYWGDWFIIFGVVLMIVGLRVKLSDNLKEEQVNLIKAEQTIVGKININTATVRQLVDLPSIGDKMAQRIVDYRVSIGKFNSKDQLKEVSGIGDKTYETLKDKIDL